MNFEKGKTYVLDKEEDYLEFMKWVNQELLCSEVTPSTWPRPKWEVRAYEKPTKIVKAIKIVETKIVEPDEKTFNSLKSGLNNVEKLGWIYKQPVITDEGEKNIYTQILAVELMSYGGVFVSIVQVRGSGAIVKKKLSQEEFKENLMLEVMNTPNAIKQEPKRYVKKELGKEPVKKITLDSGKLNGKALMAEVMRKGKINLE